MSWQNRFAKTVLPEPTGPVITTLPVPCGWAMHFRILQLIRLAGLLCKQEFLGRNQNQKPLVCLGLIPLRYGLDMNS